MGKTKTNDQFIHELQLVNPDVVPLEPYIKSSTPIECKCKKCESIWKSRPNNLLHGYGCPKCGIKKRAKTQSKKNDVFLKELLSINPSVELLEAYNGSHNPIKCKCRVCGYQWKVSPTNLLSGKSCPECALIISADKRRRTHAEFLEILHNFHPDIDPIEEYKGNSARIRMKCNTCGYKWTTTTSSLVIGHGCPRCAKNGTYSQEEFIKKLSTINPYIEIIGKYQRSAIPLKCKCLRCGHIWESKPNNLLSGKGCPTCYHSATSFIEQVIYEVLCIILGNDQVLSRDRKAIGKELDIYVPSLNLAIEPGSWRWHKDKIKNDQSKRELCKKAGIRLITIYSDYDEDIPPFDSDCLCVNETLGFENDIPIVKELISNLLALAGIEYNILPQEWDSIIKLSYNNSRRITTATFKQKIASVNFSVDVIGEYTGAWNKIDCVCKICSHRWSPEANSLVQGHGCPKCANMENGIHNRKTHKTFEAELKAINPNIQLSSEYRLSKQKVKCICSICGNVWEALPGNLLKGRGCPVCARKRKVY